MSRGKRVVLSLIVIGLASLSTGSGRVYTQPMSNQEKVSPAVVGTEFDPLPNLQAAFPGSIALKAKGHLVEFCSDNTCDGFVSSADVPLAELKDFAYLYVHFFWEGLSGHS
jgi:hypothetical protein